MKTVIQLFIVVTIALVSTSCLVPIYRGQGGGHGQPQRQLSSVNTTQVRTGRVSVQIQGDLSIIPQVEQYSTQFYERVGRVPTEQELTKKFGFPCRARWIDEPDNQVKMVTVRPDEVPASIRAKFQ